MSFKKWVKKQSKRFDIPVLEDNFINGAGSKDPDFPDAKGLEELTNYLRGLGFGKEMEDEATRSFLRWQKEDPKAPIDGFSAKDKERIRKACRQVWGWSHPRRVCVARATDKKGFVYCENPGCESEGEPVPRIYVDHISPVGSVDGGFLERLFVPSNQLQALCKACHAPKTKAENEARAKASSSNGVIADTPKKKRSFTDTY